VLAVFLAGCRSEVTVSLTADKNGAGAINVEAVLDKDAAAAFVNRSPSVVLDDLKSAGWTVGGPTENGDDGLRVFAEHPFANPDQANTLLKSLSGDGGPFSKLKLARSSVFITSDVKLEGAIDLTKGLAAFGDDQLRELTKAASNVGIDDAEIERQAKVPIAEAFTLLVKADLNGTKQEWSPALGTTTAVQMQTTSWAFDVLATLMVGVSALIGLLMLWKHGRTQRKLEQLPTS
jgi:hypothetical protein